MVLATNGTVTLAAFLYKDIQWGRAQIGFNAGDGYSSHMISKALTDETVNVDELSNVEEPGIFMFRIDSKLHCRDGVLKGQSHGYQYSYNVCRMYPT